MTPSKKSRNRRQAKKLHVGEFKELGFRYRVTLKQALSDVAAEQFIDRFLQSHIEPRNLALAGWIEEGFVCRYGRGSASNEDREAVKVWLTAQAEVASVAVGDLIDAWYAPMNADGL
jgi:hypothetical protein